MTFPARSRGVRPAAAQSSVRPARGPPRPDPATHAGARPKRCASRHSTPGLSRTTRSAHAPTSRTHEAHHCRASPRVLSTSRDHAQDARRRTIPDVCAAVSQTRARTGRPHLSTLLVRCRHPAPAPRGDAPLLGVVGVDGVEQLVQVLSAQNAVCKVRLEFFKGQLAIV